jgi:hypothetical protein
MASFTITPKSFRDDRFVYSFSSLIEAEVTLKLGRSVLPMTIKTNPIKTKKKVEARKLAETGCCIPIS